MCFRGLNGESWFALSLFSTVSEPDRQRLAEFCHAGMITHFQSI